MSKLKIICPNGCKDPHGRPIYMTSLGTRYDIISKKERASVHCPMCRRWTFE